MITIDIPILGQDSSIERLSCLSSPKTYCSKIQSIEEVTRPEVLVLIGTESFGKIIVSKDSKILGNKSVKDLRILEDELCIHVNLESGNKKITNSFWELHEVLMAIEDERKLFKVINKLQPLISHLLNLNEKDSKICFKALSRVFKSDYDEKQLYFRGDGHVEIARFMQVLGWRIGQHSIYKYLSGASYLVLEDDLPLTIIDSANKKITSTIIELKLIYNTKNKTKFYKIKTTDLPIIPTLAGTFISD